MSTSIFLQSTLWSQAYYVSKSGESIPYNEDNNGNPIDNNGNIIDFNNISGLNTYYYGCPSPFSSATNIYRGDIQLPTAYLYNLKKGDINIDIGLEIRLSHSGTIASSILGWCTLPEVNPSLLPYGNTAIATYRFRMHNLKVMYDEGLFSSVDGIDAYDYINEHTVYNFNDLGVNEYNVTRFSLNVIHRTRYDLIKRYINVDTTITDANVDSLIKRFYDQLFNNFKTYVTNYDAYIWDRPDQLFSGSIRLNLAYHIGTLIPPITKTYTNSTWSSSKTWYIKVTLSRKSWGWDTINSSNVVNYDTIYVTKRIHIRIYYNILYYHLLKS